MCELNEVDFNETCDRLIDAILGSTIHVDDKFAILSNAMFLGSTPVSTEDLSHLRTILYEHEKHVQNGCTTESCCNEDLSS